MYAIFITAEQGARARSAEEPETVRYPGRVLRESPEPFRCYVPQRLIYATETQLGCGGRVGAQADTATKGCPRMGCTTRRTTPEEAVNPSSHSFHHLTPHCTILVIHHRSNPVPLVILTFNARTPTQSIEASSDPCHYPQSYLEYKWKIGPYMQGSISTRPCSVSVLRSRGCRLGGRRSRTARS